MLSLFNHPSTLAKRRKLRQQATPQEVILWSRLRRRALGPKFRRQYAVDQYIVDFCCVEKKLIIEVDGWQHGTSSGEHYDRQRTQYLEQLGFRVLRFWNNEINNNLEGVLIRIRENLEECVTSPTPSLAGGEEK